MYITEEMFKKLLDLTQKLTCDAIEEEDYYLYTKDDPYYDFDVKELATEIGDYLEKVETICVK